MRYLSFLWVLLIASFVNAHPYEAGQVRIAAGGGGGPDGWSIGVSGGYFVIDALELGLGTTYIQGKDLSIVQVTGRTTYVFMPDESFNPYAGTFVRRWIVTDGDASDQSSLGGRLGFYHVSSSNLILGLGVAQEVILDCDDDQCDSTYPEFSLALVF